EKIARGDKNDPENFPGVKGVRHTVTMVGLSILLSANTTNFASLFIVLDPFEKRKLDPEMRDTVIMAKLRKAWARKLREEKIDAIVTVRGASPIPGLGTAGGFKLIVQDKGGLGLSALQTQSDVLVGKLKGTPGLNNVSCEFRAKTPQIFLDIDRTKAAALGVSLQDVNQTL